jgi:hypothetical protein
MKTRFRITINVPEGVPEGTALLFALAELIKDVPAIIDEPRWRIVVDDMDEGDVTVSVSQHKVSG